MDARRGLAALLGRARPVRGPAACAAVDDAPGANPLSGPGGRRLARRSTPRRPAAGRQRLAAGLADAAGRRPRAGSGAAATRPNPLATGLKLKPAPLEPTDLRFPINLATALRLSDARPLIVAAAQASVWVAEAELTRAKVLWVPTLNIGFDYIRHDGGGPDFNKGIMTAPSVNFFYGGAGLWRDVATTDAIFQPLVARQVLNARHWDIQTAKNDALLQTADAYFRVHQYRGMYAGALYSVERGHDLVERIAQLSQELVPEVEVDRARNMLADLEQQAVSARQEWRVQSANLTQVLRLDPRAVVEPLEHDHLQITLIDPGRVARRPDADRPDQPPRARLAPGAGPGGGGGDPPGEGAPVPPQHPAQRLPDPLRDAPGRDLRPRPQQQPEPVGGPCRPQLSAPLAARSLRDRQPGADQGAARRCESRAIIEFFKTQDMVAADVTRAQARRPVGGGPGPPGRSRPAHGHHHLQRELRGPAADHPLGNVLVLVNRPQEAVFALQLLKLAFDEYFTTVAEYNRAQFELFHALGYPARELASLRTPGEVLPVDTARPAYLPPVGNGPPPATR